MKHLGGRRRFVFVFGILFFLAPGTAWAAGEAGPAPAGGGTLTADGDGNPATDTPTHINPADGEGIYYSVTESFTLYVNGQVSTIQTSAVFGMGIGQMSSGGAGDTFDLVIDTTDPTPVSITTTGNGGFGIYGAKTNSSSSGAVRIISAGSVTTNAATALYGQHRGTGELSIFSTGAVTTTGSTTFPENEGTAIEATHSGSGNILITSNGTVTTASGIGLSGVHSGSGNITINSNAALNTGATALWATHSGSGAITINSNGTITASATSTLRGIHVERTGTGNVQINSVGDITLTTTTFGYGIGVRHTGTGDVFIDSDGTIDLTGSANGLGIYVYAPNSSATVDVAGQILTGNGRPVEIDAGGSITFSTTEALSSSRAGGHAVVLYAGSSLGTIPGIVDVDIDQSITTTGAGAKGLLVDKTNDGDVTVDTTPYGSLTTTGTAIDVQHRGAGGGNVSITTNAPINVSGSDPAVYVYINNSGNLTFNANSSVTAAATGIYGDIQNGNITFSTTGAISAGGTAVYFLQGGANTTADLDVGQSITTTGSGSTGIFLQKTSTGQITLDLLAPLNTAGRGIDIRFLNQGDITLTLADTITTTDGPAIFVTRNSTLGAGGNITITQQNVLTVGGANAAGIFVDQMAQGSSDRVVIDSQADISALGQGSVGIVVVQAGGSHSATNPRDVVVTVAGTVRGGWDTGAGVFFQRTGGTSPLTLNVQNTATVEALSDRAIAGASNSPLTIENYGTIVGFIDLSQSGAGTGDDVLNNYSNNSINLRNFYDSDGDGTRDTEGVAVSDFGGGNDLFNNTSTGTLRLLTVTGATNFDPDMTFVPPGHAARSLSVEGVEHGALVNLETFVNAGTIDMQDARTGGSSPVWGDRLIITGNASITSGMTSGGGVFRSEGGSLYLDTVINDGSTDQTDVLVIDRAVLGSGGPTRVFIRNAGGTGGPTGNGPTDGILLIQALDMPGSDAGAFVLGSPLVVGLFGYDLVAGDQGWYLQTVSVLPHAAVVTLFPTLFREPLGVRGRESTMLANQQPLEACYDRPYYAQGRWDSGFSYRDGVMDAEVFSGTVDRLRVEWYDRRYHVTYTSGIYGNWRAAASGYARWADFFADNGRDRGRASVQAEGFGMGAELGWSSGGWQCDRGLVVVGAVNFTQWTDLTIYDNDTNQAADLEMTNWSLGLEAVYYLRLGRMAMLAPRGQVALYGNSDESFQISGYDATLGDTTWWAGRFGAAAHLPIGFPWGYIGSWTLFTDWVYHEQFAYDAAVAGISLGADGATQWVEYGTSLNVDVTNNLVLYVQLRGASQTASLDYRWLSLGTGGQLLW